MPEGVLLVNLDKSDFPNLALMHISTWKKGQGYEVGWNVPDPEEVYASCVFDWNRHRADGLKTFYPDARIDVGGSGINLTKKLPEEVSFLMPDYSLYPGIDYDVGRTTLGCVRNCYFCVVPRKEGTFRRHQHPRQFHDPSHHKVVFIDNNVLADRSWFFEVTDWCIQNEMEVDFNQGLDLRLLDEEIAARIAELKPMKYWHFAFDSLGYEEAVKRGVPMLIKAGVDMRHRANVYVYCDGDHDYNSAVYRCKKVLELGSVPYLMLNRNAPRTQRLTDLKRWTRPQIIHQCAYEDYRNTVRPDPLDAKGQTLLDQWGDAGD